MARKYLYELPGWPTFTWDAKRLASLLSTVRLNQGVLLGKMRDYGFASRWTATLKVLTEETIKSSAIEGVALNAQNVRSSIALKLGLDAAGIAEHKDRSADGVVNMMLDATQKFREPLNKDRLFRWHSDLFPTLRTTADTFRVGAWRDDKRGAMQVISGPIGRAKVHYVAPSADRIESEMSRFLHWIDGGEEQDPLLKAAVAHFWFVTIHPFDDGNGRIARAITEMCLARSDGSEQRFYSMSAQILEERKDYYDVLEKSQSGTLDITQWVTWFLNCLDRSIARAEKSAIGALDKVRFWERLRAKHVTLNERQTKVINKMLSDFTGKLTRQKWMRIAKTSSRTALRDIEELIELEVLEREDAGGRSTSYRLMQTDS